MTITFMGFHQPLDGYGYATMCIAEELKRLDPEVRIIDMTGGPEKVYDLKTQWEVEGTAVALCVPEWLPNIHCDRLIAYTMSETNRLLAKDWGEQINRHTAACLVPCQWCVEVFRANGITAPIEVVKWGINPNDYYPLERQHDGQPYTFLWSGTPDRRKGWDVAYRAFDLAFRDNPSARLILHFREALPGNPKFGDWNVQTVVGYFNRPELRAMLQLADCFVFPSRGEGWGSPPREAAATGLPVIATDFGGLAEEIEHWGLPIRTVGTSRAEYWCWQDIGEWVEPDLVQVAQQMNWCFEHTWAAQVHGRNAARWLRENATWERTAKGILAAVDKVGQA